MAISLRREFENWLKTIYPDLPQEESDQWRQLRDAFFSGCLVAYTSDAVFTSELKLFGAELHASCDAKGGDQ
jgi:hypothetical protein